MTNLKLYPVDFYSAKKQCTPTRTKREIIQYHISI